MGRSSRGAPTEESSDASPPANLREATLDDCETVLALQRSLGLALKTEPGAERRSWESLWHDNPALRMGRPAPPLGWVLEAEGRVVGFFGSVAMRYQFGDQALVAGVGLRWAVEKPFRGQTAELAGAYFDQPHVDLLLGTTGTPASGRIYHRHGGASMPEPDFDRVLFWVLDAGPLASGALHSRGVPKALSSAVGAMAGPLARALVSAGRLRPGRPRAGIDPESIRVDEVGDEFDDLWKRKLGEGRRLFANRSAEDLRWHLQSRGTPRSVTVIRCRRGGRLEGYLVWERNPIERMGIVRAKIVDLFVAGDAPELIDALLTAAYETALEQRCHFLEWIGFPRALRDRARRCRPLWRTLTPNSFAFKARSPELHAALRQPDAWYPCRYDGDGSLG